FFFFQSEDGIRDFHVTGVQTCALPICFVGPTTVFAFMQAMGLINDHAEGCITRDEVARARETFTRPDSGPASRTRRDAVHGPTEIGRATCRERVRSMAGTVAGGTTGRR